MPDFSRHKEDEPFRGEAYYQIAHDAEQSFFEDITGAIDELFINAESPILNREFIFERDGAYSFLQTNIFIDDNHDTSKVNVEQVLSIAHTACRPPRCVKDYYHVRVEDKVEIAINPIVTEYYIERLSNGHYFGTMTRFDVTIGSDVPEDTFALYGDEEPMTVYDLFALLTTLGVHRDTANEESVFANLIRSDE